MKEHGEKIPAEERGKVESSINNLREALKGDDADAIKKAHDTLMTDAQTIGKIVYEEVAKQQAAAGAGGAAGPTSEAPTNGTANNTPEDVIDAEFEVKDASVEAE